MKSSIIVTNDFDQAKKDMLAGYKNNFIRYFEEDSFLIEHSKNVIKEAYIKENQTKYIVLIAKNYNQYAQNALLKIIEEPPSNIVFLIFVQNISSLLPTVQSRMIVQTMLYKTQKVDIGIDIGSLDLQTIYEYVKTNKYMKPNDLKLIIETIFQKAIKNGIVFDEQDLKSFDKLFQLATLYGNPFNILLKVLMMIYNKKK